MAHTTSTLTPLQHQRQLGRLIMPLMYVLNSGLDEIGEAQLADLSNQNLETCRLQLRRLASYGYLERSARYQGYRLTPLAYEVLPQRGNLAPAQPAPTAGDPPNPARHSPIRSPAAPSQPFPAAYEPALSALPTPGTPPAAASAESHDRGFAASASPQRGNTALTPGVNGDGSSDSPLNIKNIKDIYNRESPQSPTTPDSPTPDLCGSVSQAGELEPAGEDASPDEDGEQEAAWDEDDEFEVDYTPRSPEEIQAARRALRALGIGEPTRSQLLALDYITEAYINEWRASLNEFPGPGKWKTGLLILRLRSEEWPPILGRQSHSGRSYTEGEFADWIEH